MSRSNHRKSENKQCGSRVLLTIARPSENDNSSFGFTNRGYHGSPDMRDTPNSRISGNWRDDKRNIARPVVSMDEESLFSPSIHHPKHIRPRNKVIATAKCSTRNKLIYRCFQVITVIILGVSLYALVENIKYLIRTTYEEEPHNGIRGQGKFNEELQSWLVREDSNNLLDDFTSPRTRETGHQNQSIGNLARTVIDINSLSFVLNNESVCQSQKSEKEEEIYFMMIVHSAPENFEARNVIRNTWGSVHSLRNVSVRLLFVLGQTNQSSEDSDLIENSVTRESEIFGDIVTGSFIDSYKNLTYKHLLGYKWAATFCTKAAYIIKADDDAFIDIFQLYDFVVRTFGRKPPPNSLICNVFPEGSKPIRSSDAYGTKWAVSSDEYPYSVYPKYCGGLAYLFTTDVAKRVLSVSDKVRFFWIDDVFVTGILREMAGIEPFYLNLRYTYDPQQYRNWILQTRDDNNKVNSTKSVRTSYKNYPVKSSVSKFPFIVTHIERTPRFSEEMKQLWNKTLQVWSKQFEPVTK